MPWLIHTTLDPALASVREKTRPAHLAYLAARMDLLMAAGATLSDDGATATGSFYLLKVEDRAAAEAFMAAEPYNAAGILSDVTMTRCRNAIFGFARVTPP